MTQRVFNSFLEFRILDEKIRSTNKMLKDYQGKKKIRAEKLGDVDPHGEKSYSYFHLKNQREFLRRETIIIIQ